MNIWNKVFLGVIIVAAIAVLALGSLEMRIRSTGLIHTDSLEARIAKTEDDIAKIEAGTATELGFDALRVALGERLSVRSRAWFGCRVSGNDVNMLDQGLRTLVPGLPTPLPDLPQVVAQVLITNPLVPGEAGAQPEVVRPDHLQGVVYVFEQIGEAGETGAFLGRFNVHSTPTRADFLDGEGNQIAGYRVTLITADPVDDGEIDLIFDATGSPWAIFQAPPIDRYAGIFDNLTEEQKQMIPPEMLERFQPRPMPELTDDEKEGVPAGVIAAWEKIRARIDDPEVGTAKDYTTVLDWLYERLSTVCRNIQNTEADIETYKTATDGIRAENTKLKADGDLEEKRAAAMEVQREAVETLLGEYQVKVNDLTLQAEKLQAENEAYVAQIVEFQAKAIELMEAQAAAANAARGEEE